MNHLTPMTKNNEQECKHLAGTTVRGRQICVCGVDVTPAKQECNCQYEKGHSRVCSLYKERSYEEILKEVEQEKCNCPDKDGYFKSDCVNHKSVQQEKEEDIWFEKEMQKVRQSTKEEIIKLIEGEKPNERKVADYEDYQAETYDEKMLVRSALEKIITLINHI